MSTLSVGKAMLITGIIGVISMIYLIVSGNCPSQDLQILGTLVSLIILNLGIALTQIQKERTSRIKTTKRSIGIGMLLIANGKAI